MTLPLLIAVLAMLFFGVVAIIYSVQEYRLKSRLKEEVVLSSILNSLEDGICVLNKNSELLAVNKKTKELLQIEKRSPSLMDILSSLPNTYNFAEKIKKVILQNQKIEEKAVPHYDKLLNIYISPLQSLNKITGALFLIRDATLEKDISKMKEDFTSIIVHELRSPLTSIKASSEMLSGENNLTDEEKKRLITIIGEQTNKMLDQVGTILDPTKLDKLKTQLSPSQSHNLPSTPSLKLFNP